ncbi:MAG: hypothetical protein JXQ72_14745 [Anaerolineae bacterium]|nr:hypothetical protein [Anaerolineae bacterium]
MNGLFGVGFAELLIVMLALFIIGGPKNTAKWARELGRLVRKARVIWAQVIADLEEELGPEGKELMDTARELSQGANEARKNLQGNQLINNTLRMVEESVDLEQAGKSKSGVAPSAVSPTSSKPPASSENGKSAPTADSKYQAWLPPDDTQTQD